MRSKTSIGMLASAGILTLLFFVRCASDASYVKTRDFRNSKSNNKIEDSEFYEESNDFSNAQKDKGDTWPAKKADAHEQNTGREKGDSAYKKDSYYQTGMASWYGREFNGKRTASGERFDMHGLTAAHKTLPFGTVLKVKNFDNGKTVTVRINDRGPYKGGRIIDLSYGAAKNLGMLQDGQTQVGIQILKNGESEDTYKQEQEDAKDGDVEAVSDASDGESSPENGPSSIQTGAFYSKRNADMLKERIEGITDNRVVIIHDGDMYKVRIEAPSSKKELNRLKRSLSEDNIPSYMINKND
jgi:rare lipoprotein A